MKVEKLEVVRWLAAPHHLHCAGGCSRCVEEGERIAEVTFLGEVCEPCAAELPERMSAKTPDAAYAIGRADAAEQIVAGFTHPFGNGGVHFDSDVEAPPDWMVIAAANLAAGLLRDRFADVPRTEPVIDERWKSFDPLPAIYQIRLAVGPMSSQGDSFLSAVAELLNQQTMHRHMPVDAQPRDVLGGYLVRCMCGGRSVHLDPAQPLPLCDRLAEALAIAEAYLNA